MRLLNRILSIMFIGLLPATAIATQVKIAPDNAVVVGKISEDEVSRLSLVNDRIKSIKANKGRFGFVNDERNGDVYIRTLQGNYGAPLNGFVISEKGYTYKLLLNPVDIPSAQIFIKNPAITRDETQKNDEEPTPYKQELISLIKSMGHGEVIPEYEIDTVRISQDISHNDLKLIRRVIYHGQKYDGGIYELSNSGDLPVYLNEQIFLREGVRAIKLDAMEIKPDEKINVYMIEDRS